MLNEERIRDDILLLGLFFITVFTRVPFRSRLLYHWDSVQFALALGKYDITVHQPHPPGYFLYVMIGRFINLFIKDANNTFIFISILFSGLAVVTIFYFGKEIFDKKIGILAAAIAIASPNMWFHGEVALTYIVEAFFSTFVALLCWRTLKGDHKYVWFSAIAIGIAGGVRQNTMVFLLPLWLFSVKGVPIRKVLLSLGLLGIICLLWFVPMIWMTGGWGAYHGAFKQLWLFNTGLVSVFEKGWGSFKMFSSALYNFVVYGLGAGIFILCVAAFSLIRYKRLGSLDIEKVFFFSLWIMPSVLFYLLIFIHPANPGYVLIFLPALFIVTSVSIEYVSDDLKRFIKRDFSKLIALTIIIVNIYLFFFSRYPVSYREIRDHDRNLSIMLEGIKTFNPKTTAIFAEPYVFYGFRHIMYYLPEYRVYLINVRISSTGERMKTFWGSINKEPFRSEEITLPGHIKTFIVPTFSDIRDRVSKARGESITTLSNGIFIASGHFGLIKEFFPELKINIQNSTYDLNLE
jgi:MFS family permease